MKQYVKTNDPDKMLMVVDGMVAHAINPKCQEWVAYKQFLTDGGVAIDASPSEYHDLVGSEWVLSEERQAEMVRTLIGDCERAVEAHILLQVTSFGYRDENSISKYMARSNSPWCAECLALGDWIDACWLKCHELLNTGKIISIEDLIISLPVYAEV